MGYSRILARICCMLCIWITTELGMAKSVSAENKETDIIELTQTGCQFLEPEGKDHQFQTTGGNDCKKINEKSGIERLKSVKPMKLKPGKYTFRITNKNVPYPLGFWLRGVGLQQITLPSVSGGGLTTGSTKSYQIILKPGKYVYSCPLNPTPNYPIIVE